VWYGGTSFGTCRQNSTSCSLVLPPGSALLTEVFSSWPLHRKINPQTNNALRKQKMIIIRFNAQYLNNPPPPHSYSFFRLTIELLVFTKPKNKHFMLHINPILPTRSHHPYLQVTAVECNSLYTYLFVLCIIMLSVPQSVDVALVMWLMIDELQM